MFCSEWKNKKLPNLLLFLRKLDHTVLAGCHPVFVLGVQFVRKPFHQSADQVRLHRSQRAQGRRMEAPERVPERSRVRKIEIPQQFPVVQVTLEDQQMGLGELLVEGRSDVPHAVELVRRRPEVIDLLQVERSGMEAGL